nr:MAG TPA: hypothetical protein [Caudoviricetes sp.]
MLIGTPVSFEYSFSARSVSKLMVVEKRALFFSSFWAITHLLKFN